MRRPKLFPLLIVFLSACTPMVTGTPRPSPQAVSVSYSPVLSLWVDELHQCALDHPEIALITLETGIYNPDFETVDLILWFGEPPQGIFGFAASLGRDEIVMIAGREVNISELTTDQLRELYLTTDSIYQLWTYGQKNELRIIFDQTVLQASAPSSEVLFAPNPAAMLETISANPLAIGYIPKSWLNGDVNQIQLDDNLRTAFEHPILALAATEPRGGLRSYLACLQNPGP